MKTRWFIILSLLAMVIAAAVLPGLARFRLESKFPSGNSKAIYDRGTMTEGWTKFLLTGGSGSSFRPSRTKEISRRASAAGPRNTPNEPRQGRADSSRAARTFCGKISVDCSASRNYPLKVNQVVSSLEKAVEQLGREDFAVFREWFLVFEAAEWDAQIERDISAGKLDKLAAEGIEEFMAGKTRCL